MFNPGKNVEMDFIGFQGRSKNRKKVVFGLRAGGSFGKREEGDGLESEDDAADLS